MNENSGKSPVRFYIHTLGCRVNQYESDAMAAALKAAGWREIGEDETEADVGIVHTCAVTQEAARKSGQMIRRMKTRFHAKMVVAVGCQVELAAGKTDATLSLGNRNKDQAAAYIIESYAAFSEKGEHVREEDLPERPASLPAYVLTEKENAGKETYFSASFGQHGHREAAEKTTDRKGSAAEGVRKGVRDESLVCHLPERHREQNLAFSEMGRVTGQKGCRAYIKVQDGCDMHCSYCAINKARGASRSRDPFSVFGEAEALLESGYRELILTGIEVSAYGFDFKDRKIRLIDLMERIDAMPGLERMLLASLDPRIADRDFVRRLSGLKHFGAHFHLSLQSGSDAVLKRMRRPYTAKFYAEAVQRIYEYFPEANLTTDLITGFPGETEEEHEASLRFCEAQGFSDFHVFPYSDRPDTEASRLPNKVDKATAKRRLRDFQVLRDLLWKKRASREIGRTHLMLAESVRDGWVKGYSENYLPLLCSAQEAGAELGTVYATEVVAEKDGVLLVRLLKA